MCVQQEQLCVSVCVVNRMGGVEGLVYLAMLSFLVPTVLSVLYPIPCLLLTVPPLNLWKQNVRLKPGFKGC